MSRYSKLDAVICLILTAFILLFALLYIDGFAKWADDYAAYINEGIAIAEGRFHSETALYKFLHPTPLPEECDDSLVYVWGYPLMLSAVYKLVGYDQVNFSTVVYYKLPTVICLALCAAALYLLLRRRSGVCLSLLVSACFGLSTEFFEFTKLFYSDIVFMFFSTLALLITELFLGEKDTKRQWIYAVSLGVIMFYTYETRLNGIVVCVCIAAAQLIRLVKTGEKPGRAAVLCNMTPWLLFFALRFVFEVLILSPATPNTSDLSIVSFGEFKTMLLQYGRAAAQWLREVWDKALFSLLPPEYGERLAGIAAKASLLLMALGVFSNGIKRDLHLTAYAAIMLVGVCMLPYWQGLRYLYNILPILAVFFCDGFALLASGVRKLASGEKLRRGLKRAGIAAAIIILLCLTVNETKYVRRHIADRASEFADFNSDIYSQNAFSADAIEIYNYISDHTPEDCLIDFPKPRLLYLNTGRAGFCDWVNGHSMDEADYFLGFNGFTNYSALPDTAQLLIENRQLTLYKLN